MPASFDVSVWNIAPRKNAKGKVTSYSVRWRVVREEFYESFKVRAQADSFRSDLISAQNKGESFDTITGLPASMERRTRDEPWVDLACEYIDRKWPDAAATTRQTLAEALIRVTPVFLQGGRGKPDDRDIRSALRGWAFNPPKRSEEVPVVVKEVLDWCSRNSLPVSMVQERRMLDALEKAVTTKLSGEKYAPSVARKTRSVLSGFLTYAVKQEVLDTNPLGDEKWTSMPKGNRTIDPRTVPNPVQARTLLAGIREIKRSGPRLEAFFGAMYFAALRPEEAAALPVSNLDLPKKGWGEIYVEEAHPHAGRHWTGTDQAREVRGLKSRSRGEGRLVPCPPELTALLHRHLTKYKPGEKGLVFTGERGEDVPKMTYMRVWRAGRTATFSKEVAASRLCRRPYSLRHAAVSSWLTAGVDPATVARWAGQSVAVLLEIYAACLHGQDVISRQRIDEFFGWKG
ncbi:Site-specific recombinase XerD [Saccharopolyspora shandongensis]|uniref:Site-specific recombinase XerD n=1 Tax=Saccharopolyspora shandongensis TaxID=418495 RepID=A0A1H3LGR9_9PSEU|nr:tyrosine-type recombinase/integrase [Saccharopolyspora shandongensis]SDY63662.1 Site-specific recombinase XerD [Saccharopolyspora shandongensis]